MLRPRRESPGPLDRLPSVLSELSLRRPPIPGGSVLHSATPIPLPNTGKPLSFARHVLDTPASPTLTRPLVHNRLAEARMMQPDIGLSPRPGNPAGTPARSSLPKGLSKGLTTRVLRRQGPGRRAASRRG